MLSNFYGISDEDRVIIVNDNDTVSLGKRELQFLSTPSLHWPETMMTYEKTSRILFSGDAFGTYGALNGSIFDDEVDLQFFLDEAKRYFANIIGMYTKPVLSAFSKLASLEIDMIAPSHGPIWRTKKNAIIELYKKLSNYESEDKVLIVYGTMYGFTEELALCIARKLVEKGLRVRLYNAGVVHPSFILGEAWDSKIILFGAPTYDGAPFPPIYYCAYLMHAKKLRNKYFGIFGSSGWSGRGYIKLLDLLKGLEWKLVEPIVEFRGKCKKEDCKKVDELVNNLLTVLKT